MKRVVAVLLLAVLCLSSTLFAAGSALAGPARSSGLTDPAELESFLDGFLAARMDLSHVAGLTLAVVKDGQPFLAKGYGYADVVAGRPVDPQTTLFRIGSISKLFTWISVMQLAEQGVLDLDADVNNYLDFTIPATFPQPITLKHLLTHTPGFEDRGYGIGAPTVEQLVPIGQWLATHIPARVRAPGQLASYSNYGAALAGYIVERQAGQPYDEYVEQHILQPLGLAHTTSRQPLPESLAPAMSGGYRYVDSVFQAQIFEPIVVAPAGSFSASATDMATFMIALLNYGRSGQAQILQEATMRQMFSRLFTHDDRLNGMAYGFYEMNGNGQWILGHGGDTDFFHSQLAVLPEQGVGFFASCNTESCSGLPQELFQAFLDHYYPVAEAGPAQPAVGQDRQLDRFEGNYRMTRSSYTTMEKVLRLMSAIKVTALDDGSLLITSPVGPMRFVEVEPLLFRQVGGKEVIAFRQDEQGRITHAFLNSYPFFAIERVPWYEASALHYALLAASLLLLLSVFLAGPIAFFAGRGRGPQPPQPRLARQARVLLFMVALLALLWSLAMILGMQDSIALVTGNVPLFAVAPALALLATALTILALVMTVVAWVKRYWNVPGRIHYTLVTLGAVALVWFWSYWNMLWWNL